MKYYFLELDGEVRRSLKDRPQWPLEEDLPPVLRNLDAQERYATLVSALPDGVDWYAATKGDYDTDDFLQAGGAAQRLLLQLGRMEDGEHMLYNISFEPTAAGAPATERVDHGTGHSMVRPEEIMTWEQGLPIMCHYVRNDQSLPSGLWLRDFDDDGAAAFQV